MNMINLETENILKSLDWSSVNERTFYHTTTDEDLIKKVTGIDIPTVKKLNADKELSCQFCYSKDTDDKITFTASVVLVDETTVWEHIEDCDNDLLEKFAEKKKPAVDYFVSDDPEEVYTNLKARFQEVFGESLLDYVTENKLDREDIAYAYIEDNPSECFDKAKDCMSDWDLRDFVKEYINDNL